VNQVVTFGHVLRDAESVDKAVNQFPVGNWLTKILQLGADPVEVIQVASQGVSGLDGAV
jgi:hypothetical protein